MLPTPRTGEKKTLQLASRVALFGWFRTVEVHRQAFLSASKIELVNLNLGEVRITHLSLRWTDPAQAPREAGLALNVRLELGQTLNALDQARLRQLVIWNALTPLEASSLTSADPLPVVLRVNVVTPTGPQQLQTGLQLSWPPESAPTFLYDPARPVQLPSDPNG